MGSSIVIETRKLTKIFGSGAAQIQALRGIDFKVASGEFVAIVGASGSGKSTMLQILGLLDEPSSGELLLDGERVHSLSDDQRSWYRGRKIGFVFQAFHLLPQLTLLENVALPLMYQGVSKEKRMERALSALSQVGLGERTHHLPQQVSGGEKQRCAIARAIVHEPKVLLADEPTGNLDSVVKRTILDQLVELNSTLEVTIVMITHDTETAASAGRVVQIQDGRLLDSATS